jgi:hypothetical protein
MDHGVVLSNQLVDEERIEHTAVDQPDPVRQAIEVALSTRREVVQRRYIVTTCHERFA